MNPRVQNPRSPHPESGTYAAARRVPLYRPYSGTHRASLRQEGETMTRLSLNLMIATAAMAAVAGSAAAQNLKADVPFSFHANGKVMAAGTYDVNVTAGTGGHRV